MLTRGRRSGHFSCAEGLHRQVSTCLVSVAPPLLTYFAIKDLSLPRYFFSGICALVKEAFSVFLSCYRSFIRSRFTMDVPEPEQTPFTAVTAQTSKITRVGYNF